MTLKIINYYEVNWELSNVIKILYIRKFGGNSIFSPKNKFVNFIGNVWL